VIRQHPQEEASTTKGNSPGMTGSAKRRGNQEGSNAWQRADGRWQVHVRHEDASGAKRRSTVYGKSAREARAKAKAMLGRVADGRPARDQRITVAAFAEVWITSTLEASDRRRTTKSLYATLARAHVVGSRLGGISLDKLRPTHIEGWIVELRSKGLSESTVRSAYTVARAVLDTAVLDGDVGMNPVA
jgi:hypothetical protein